MTKFFEYCHQLVDFFARLEDVLLALILSAMILLASAQIVMRNLFDYGFIWADPLLKIMVLWLAVLGALAATRVDKHIRIDILSRMLSHRHAALSQGIVDFFAAAVSTVVAYHAVRFVQFDYADKVMAFSGFPAWIAELVIPVGFSIIGLRFLFLGLSRFANLSGRVVE